MGLFRSGPSSAQLVLSALQAENSDLRAQLHRERAQYEEERRNLKLYLEKGGFLLASAGCSSKDWGDSFVRQMQAIFPDRKLDEVPMSHSLFRTIFDIPRLDTKQEDARLFGLTIGSKTVVIYSACDPIQPTNSKGLLQVQAVVQTAPTSYNFQNPCQALFQRKHREYPDYLVDDPWQVDEKHYQQKHPVIVHKELEPAPKLVLPPWLKRHPAPS